MGDVIHYKNGEWVLTFYIVQFCFLCFVVMRPKLGGILIAACFAFLYWQLYAADYAAGMHPLNCLIFVAIAVLGNAIQYSGLQESEKNKMEILELNKALQLEATIDDLTKLKNRNALNRDLEKYEAQAAVWRETIQAIKIPTVALPITCSSGCDYGIPEDIAGCKKMIKNADDGLYQAKERKRMQR